MNRAVIDIETIPVAGIRNESSLPEMSEEDAKAAATNALTGRIVCVGLILAKNEYGADSALAIVSGDEKKLLGYVWSFLAEKRIAGFVAHNGLGFDLPFLWKRSVIHNIKPSVGLDLRKYRKDFVFDTMAVWANWDSRNYPSLDLLARSLGLGTKNGSADQVLGLWRASCYVEIGRYCLHDCWLTYGCYCRMNFRNPTPENDIPTEIKVLEQP